MSSDASDGATTLASLLSATTPQGLLDAARAIEEGRSVAHEILVAQHHGVAVAGLSTTPFQYQAGLAAREQGIVAFNRLERGVLPPAADWLHHDLTADHYRMRLRGDRLEAPKMWPFQHDAPVADYEVTASPKWWSHGLVHTLVGGAWWPGMSELEVALVARLSEAVAAWHWYWLAELGREYCPHHSVVSGDGTPRCAKCRGLETDALRPDVRLRRLGSEHALAVATNALEFLAYEASCFDTGIAQQRIIEPDDNYLTLGEAGEYARFHHGRVSSVAWRRYVERFTAGGEVARSPQAFAARAAAAVGELLTPREPTPELAGRRARRVLQDVGWRVCHAAALAGAPADGLSEGLAAVAEGLAALRPDMDAAQADGVLAEALGRVAAELARDADPTAPAGRAAGAVLALGYRPLTHRAAEPAGLREARRGAYRRRVAASGSPLAPLVSRMPAVVEQVLDGPRTARLIEELTAGAAAASAAQEHDAVIEGALGWFAYAAEQWGPDHAELWASERWWYQLASRTLPPPDRWDAYRARPNPYINGIPTPFDRTWLEDLVADKLPQDRPLAPRFTTGHIAYALAGAGRERPVFLPLTTPRKRLLERLQDTPTLAELVAGGVTPEVLAQAIAEGLILCFGQREPTTLYAIHPGQPWPTAPEEATEAPADAIDTEAAPRAADDPGPWEDEEQAAFYEAFCERSALYDDLAEALVAFAEIGPGAQVADLGAGTGVSARAVLAAVGPTGSVVGVDPAPRMVAAAQRRVTDPRARFLRGTARDLAALAPQGGGFDAIVCNSALWLDADIDAALRGARAALRPGGRLGLSIIAEFLGHSEHLTTAVGEALAAAIVAAREALGLAADGAGPVPPPAGLGDAPTFTEALAAAGFSSITSTLYRRPWTLGEYLDWAAQPVMLRGMTPSLGPEGRAAFLAHLRGAVDLEAVHESRWILVRASA